MKIVILYASFGGGHLKAAEALREYYRNTYPDYEVMFITGKTYYEEVKNIKLPSNVKIAPFINGMPSLMKTADLIITRAGASTMSEIIALELPAIFVPSPFVTNNHQYKNAMDLVNKNAGLILEEKDLTKDNLYY